MAVERKSSGAAMVPSAQPARAARAAHTAESARPSTTQPAFGRTQPPPQHDRSADQPERKPRASFAPEVQLERASLVRQQVRARRAEKRRNAPILQQQAGLGALVRLEAGLWPSPQGGDYAPEENDRGDGQGPMGRYAKTLGTSAQGGNSEMLMHQVSAMVHEHAARPLPFLLSTQHNRADEFLQAGRHVLEVEHALAAQPERTETSAQVVVLAAERSGGTGAGAAVGSQPAPVHASSLDVAVDSPEPAPENIKQVGSSASSPRKQASPLKQGGVVLPSALEPGELPASSSVDNANPANFMSAVQAALSASAAVRAEAGGAQPAISSAARALVDLSPRRRSGPMPVTAADAFKAGEYEMALAFADARLEREPNSAAMRRLKGRIHGKRAEHDSAALEALRAVDLEPNNPVSHMQRANALAHLGRMPAAGSSMLSALKLEPLGQLSTAQDKYSGLLSSLRRTREYYASQRPLGLAANAVQPTVGASLPSLEPLRVPSISPPGAESHATRKSGLRRVFDERRVWVEDDSDRPARPARQAEPVVPPLGGAEAGPLEQRGERAARARPIAPNPSERHAPKSGTVAAPSSAPPITARPPLTVVYVAKHQITVSVQAEEDSTAAEGGEMGSARGAAPARAIASDDAFEPSLRVRLWLCAIVVEWDEQRATLVSGHGEWHDVPLAEVQSGGRRVIIIDKLRTNTAYQLCACFVDDADGRVGPPTKVQVTTLSEEARLIDHADIPDSWRNIPLEDVPAEQSKLANKPDFNAMRLAAVRSHNAMEQLRGAIVDVLRRHRQLLVSAFRYACLLVALESDDGNKAMLEVERTRTRLRKQYDLQPRKIIIVLSPGPNIESVKALLVAARLHIEGACELVAVVCNGGGTKEVATQRTILARALLNSQRMYDVPIGIGEPSGKPYKAPPHEYSFPGYTKVDRAKLRDGQEVLRDVLEAAEPRSLTFVLLSALSDMAKLITSEHQQTLYSKVALVTTMGGCVLHWGEAEGEGAAPRMRGHDRPEAITPDNAANNQLDPDAASVVYSWCLEKHIPLRVIGREAICDVPMRIFKQMAEAHPHDPVMKYIRTGQEQGLIGLWKRVCRGEIPNCDRKWFFDKFCGVAEAEFERRGFDKLTEAFQIERRLDGTVKPYDAVALLLALAPEDSANAFFAFRKNKRAPGVFVFEEKEYMVPSAPVIEVFQQTLVAVVRSKAAGFARFRPRRNEFEGPLSHSVTMGSFVRFARQCQIVEPPSITLVKVERAFMQTTRLIQLAQPSDDGDDDHQLGLRDFIAGLVRLAQMKYAEQMTPVEGLEKLINLIGEHMPLSTKMEDDFLHRAMTPSVRAMLIKWQPALREIFDTYASFGRAHETSIRRQERIDVTDLHVLAQDAGLLDKLSVSDLVALFVQTRADQEPLENDADSDASSAYTQLEFWEFNEWIARVCHAHALKARGKPAGILHVVPQAATPVMQTRFANVATLASGGKPRHGTPKAGDRRGQLRVSLLDAGRSLAKSTVSLKAAAESAREIGPADESGGDETAAALICDELDRWISGELLPRLRPVMQRKAQDLALSALGD